MRPADWEKTLVGATHRVQLKVSALARKGDGSRYLGRGASGDKTILADKLAEDELLKTLRRLDGVRILSEEAGWVGDGRTLAMVDPLDGSSNFERGIPFYCTSVAIAEGETIDEVTMGVVRDLVSGDVYVAKKGMGATKNGRRITTSKVSDASEAVVGVDLSRSPRGLASRLVPLTAGVKRQLHFGANALELCYVAEGRMDAFVDVRRRIRVTDFAAGYLIATEAGATVTDGDGNPLAPGWDLEHRHTIVAAGGSSLHGQIMRLSRAAREDSGVRG